MEAHLPPGERDDQHGGEERDEEELEKRVNSFVEGGNGDEGGQAGGGYD